MDYRPPIQPASYPTAAKSVAARAPRQRRLPFAAPNTQQLRDCHPVILCRRQIMSGCLTVTNSAKPVFSPSYSFLDVVLKESACIIPSPKIRMHIDKLGNQIPCRRYQLRSVFFCQGQYWQHECGEANFRPDIPSSRPPAVQQHARLYPAPPRELHPEETGRKAQSFKDSTKLWHHLRRL